MIKLATWSVYQADGRYLGQQHAFAADIAFCQYMALMGENVIAQELKGQDNDGKKSRRIEYKLEEFVLRSSHYAGPVNL